MKKKQKLSKFTIPIFYSLVMLFVIFYQWNQQSTIRKGGSQPIHQNLADMPAYVKRGFDIAELKRIDEVNRQIPHGTELSPYFSGMVKFESWPLRVMNSSLDNLPKRPFLSPFGRKAEEFTIVIPIEMDSRTLSFLDDNPHILPGVYFSAAGENWEIFFNGRKIRGEMHLDDNGQIRERRAWRRVYFPLDRSFLVPGNNTLVLHVVGDPTYRVTGIGGPTHYIDDFHVIEGRQRYYLAVFLCGIFGFSVAYYLLLFLYVRKKGEVFNLYFALFSILLCVYIVTNLGIIDPIIPNSDITTRMEYGSLMLLIPVFCIFIETLGRGKITLVTRGYSVFCLFLCLSQIFFCAQYGEDAMLIWNLTVPIYFSYVFFYDVIYFYFWDKKGPRRNRASDAPITYIIAGTLFIFICGLYEILDVLFFTNSYSLFVYSTFAVQIGMTFALSQRFSGMYKRLEKSNVMLESAVRDRTLELEEQTEIAVRASSAKSEFLANMSHEIRTPINSIVGFSELAMDDYIAPKTREYLGRIKENTVGLLQIINDILDISKVESGRMELECIPFDLHEIFTNCETVFVPKAIGKGLALQFSIQPMEGKKLLGDPTKLRQVLLNILSNAIKFTETGVVKVSSSVENSIKDSNGNKCTVHFEIIDSGIGMTGDQIQRIYEPFAQADASITRKFGGTGLGLSICKNFISLMGGELMVESTPGVGSKFSFDLCFDLAVSDEKPAATIPTEIEKPVFEGEVLVCEDNSMNQEVIIDHLSRVGVNTVIAQNGKEGVELVLQRKEKGEKPFDLIFMDIHMPVMDGLEAASKITELQTGTPIVAMTANIMSHDRELYKMNYMPDCVDKPFTSQQLWHCLKKYLKPAAMSVEATERSILQEADRYLQERFRESFFKENQTKYEDITKALDTGDIKLAHRLAHTLKSNAALLGKENLRKASAEVEALLKDGKNLVTQEHLDLFRAELNSVLEEFS